MSKKSIWSKTYAELTMGELFVASIGVGLTSYAVLTIPFYWSDIKDFTTNMIDDIKNHFKKSTKEEHEDFSDDDSITMKVNLKKDPCAWRVTEEL